MKESNFTKKLRKYVKENGGGSYKLGASLFLEKGMPDTIFFLAGFTFFLESKIWPRKPEPLQKAQIKRIKEWGGYAWAVTWKEDGIILLDDVEFGSIEETFDFIVEHIKSGLSKRV